MYTVYVISYNRHVLALYTVLSYMHMAQDKSVLRLYSSSAEEGLLIDITSATYTFSATKFRRTVG